MRTQLQKYDELYAQLAAFQSAAANFDANDTEETVRARWQKLLTESPLSKGTPFAAEYRAVSDGLRKLTPGQLVQKRRQLELERQKLLDARANRQLAGQDDSPQDLANLRTVELGIDFIRFEEAIRVYLTRPWLRLPAERRPIEQAYTYRSVADFGTLLGLHTRNQRNDAIHDQWPDVAPVQLDGQDLLTVPLDEAATQAAQTALNLRLDLMNARAQLVDSYRQIGVRANALQGVFDVQYDYSTNSPLTGSNGAALGGSRSKNTLTMRFDPPLVRRVERNLYRASLVAFQRQRRFLMAVEDNIVNDVRADLRQTRASAQSYLLQQRAVELAYAQVDSARSTLVAPPDPGARESAGNVAALTDQLLRAQAQLLRSQNLLYTTWIAYQTARTSLYLDLELMPLDCKGKWTDELVTGTEPVAPAP
jgi:hypothetical protein